MTPKAKTIGERASPKGREMPKGNRIATQNRLRQQSAEGLLSNFASLKAVARPFYMEVAGLKPKISSTRIENVKAVRNTHLKGKR